MSPEQGNSAEPNGGDKRVPVTPNQQRIQPAIPTVKFRHSNGDGFVLQESIPNADTVDIKFTKQLAQGVRQQEKATSDTGVRFNLPSPTRLCLGDKPDGAMISSLRCRRIVDGRKFDLITLIEAIDINGKTVEIKPPSSTPPLPVVKEEAIKEDPETIFEPAQEGPASVIKAMSPSTANVNKATRLAVEFGAKEEEALLKLVIDEAKKLEKKDSWASNAAQIAMKQGREGTPQPICKLFVGMLSDPLHTGRQTHIIILTAFIERIAQGDLKKTPEGKILNVFATKIMEHVQAASQAQLDVPSVVYGSQIDLYSQIERAASLVGDGKVIQQEGVIRNLPGLLARARGLIRDGKDTVDRGRLGKGTTDLMNSVVNSKAYQALKPEQKRELMQRMVNETTQLNRKGVEVKFDSSAGAKDRRGKLG